MLTAADESTWRKGIWDTLSTFGMSLIQGAGMGLVAGGVMGGGVARGGGLLTKGQVGKLEDFATKAGIDMGDLKNLSFGRRRMVGTLSDHIKAGEADKAEKVLLEMQAEIGQDPATRIRKQLYVANEQPLAKPHIDAYMEQLIRRQSRAFDIAQQQWVEREGFFHGDPACLQTFVRRTDEEMMYALSMANTKDSLIFIFEGFLRSIVGSIGNQYTYDYNQALPLDAELPAGDFEPLKRGTEELGRLEIVYLALCHLLAKTDEDYVRLNESEQEWSNDEMRHLVQEIKAKWFPCPQPYLDVLTDKVVFYTCSWEQWWNEDLPHLIEILPKLKSCEKIEHL